MALKIFWAHLFQKFYLLSSDWHNSVSRPAHSRIWHFWSALSTPKTLNQPEGTAQASKSALHRLHQPQLNQATAWVFFSTDGWTDTFFRPCWKRQICCSMDIQITHACNPAIVWTTSKGLRPFMRSVCLHFACLVTFSWMRSQPAIQRLRSGFYELKTSNVHQEMLWHRWFHPSTVGRSVWHASMFLRLHLRCSIPGVNNMHPKHLANGARDFRTMFLATMSSSRQVGGSPRIQNIALDSDILVENSRHQNIEYDSIEHLTIWIQQKDTSNHAKPTFFCAMQRPGSESESEFPLWPLDGYWTQHFW